MIMMMMMIRKEIINIQKRVLLKSTIYVSVQYNINTIYNLYKKFLFSDWLNQVTKHPVALLWVGKSAKIIYHCTHRSNLH